MMAKKQVDYDTFDDPETPPRDTTSRNESNGSQQEDENDVGNRDILSGSKMFSGIYTAEDRERVEKQYTGGRIIFPWYKSYKSWWAFTVFAAIFMGCILVDLDFCEHCAAIAIGPG